MRSFSLQFLFTAFSLFFVFTAFSLFFVCAVLLAPFRPEARVAHPAGEGRRGFGG